MSAADPAALVVQISAAGPAALVVWPILKEAVMLALVAVLVVALVALVMRLAQGNFACWELESHGTMGTRTSPSKGIQSWAKGWTTWGVGAETSKILVCAR